MTDDELAAIRTRVEASTPGDWVSTKGGRVAHIIADTQRGLFEDRVEDVITVCGRTLDWVRCYEPDPSDNVECQPCMERATGEDYTARRA